MLKNLWLAVAFVGMAPLAHAADACKVELAGNDQMQYDKKELKFPAECAGKEITITLKHSGKLPKAAMGHNVVVYVDKEEIKQEIINKGAVAGAGANFVDPSLVKDKKVLGFSPVVGGGETTELKLKPNTFKAGETYGYVCSFPGHGVLMSGKLVIETGGKAG